MDVESIWNGHELLADTTGRSGHSNNGAGDTQKRQRRAGRHFAHLGRNNGSNGNIGGLIQHSNSRKVLDRMGSRAETARGCSRGTVDSS